MSKIKLIKELKMSEIEHICDNAEGCVKCPLLLSSYHKNIRCLREDEVKTYDIEKAYNILNTQIDLETLEIR